MTTVSSLIEAKIVASSWSIEHVFSQSDTIASIKSKAVSWYPIAKSRSWTDGEYRWRLKTLLLVEVRSTQREVLALTRLAGDVEEYGLGSSELEAIDDLLTSLSDYRRSLESVEDQLAPSAQVDLRALEELMERERLPSG